MVTGMFFMWCMNGKLSQNPPMVMIAHESSDTRNVFLASSGFLRYLVSFRVAHHAGELDIMES